MILGSQGDRVQKLQLELAALGYYIGEINSNFDTQNYKVVFIPTFETSEMVLKSKRRINTKSVRSMLTWSHYRFKQLLISMAELSGVLVVEMSEAFTSKTCGKCGHIHAKLGGSKIFKCPECGYVVDRDANGEADHSHIDPA